MAMNTAYFNLSAVASLQSIVPQARIHVIGVAGVAMAPIACALASRGFNVTGSDKEFYEPMGSLLKRSGITLIHGYKAENIQPNLDLVVIGNAVSASHPEVNEVARLKLPYTIFPALLHDLAIKDKHSIVVTGTHGKTTTSAMGAFVLSELGTEPSYFVGGVLKDLPLSLQIGKGRFSIVEGDEYDSAFFAKVPKFTFYRPDTLIITSIEYDHADIYPSLESILVQFESLIASLPTQGRLIWCSDETHLSKLLDKMRSAGALRAESTSYGRSGNPDILVESSSRTPDKQEVTFSKKGALQGKTTLRLPGSYNANNAAAVYLALSSAGIKGDSILQALEKFHGVKRRQERRFDQGITLIEDFAHHPSAVRETLQGIRAAYGSRRIIAVFEPRSNTSRKKVFEDEYTRAFKVADHVVLSAVESRVEEKREDLMDVSTLATNIGREGTSAVALASVELIFKHLEAKVQRGDVVVVMSNGGFGGLIDTLERSFRDTFGETSQAKAF